MKKLFLDGWAVLRLPVAGLVMLTAAFAPLIVRAEVKWLELVAKTPEASDGLGYSLTTTARYTIAGAPFDDTPRGGNAGSVSVFDAQTGALVRTLMAPDGAGLDQFGFSVAASGDYLAVGAPGHDYSTPASDKGAVYLYRLSTGALLRKIGETEALPSDFFGWSVAIWGNHLLVGAPFAEGGALGTITSAGLAYLYTVDGSAAPVRIGASDATNGARFGQAVAVDHELMAIGAPFETRAPATSAGSVYLFSITPITRAPVLERKLFRTDAASSDAFGSSVDMEGNALIVGEPGRALPGGGNGRVHLYPTLTRETTGVATNAYIITNGALAGESMGAAVTLSDMMGAAGAPFRDTLVADGGAVNAFTYYGRSDSLDADAGAIYQPLGLSALQYYGSALSAYGNRLAVGASNDSTQGVPGAGAVYQYSPVRPRLASRSFYQEVRLGSAAQGVGGAVHGAILEALACHGQTFTLTRLSGAGVTTTNNKGLFLNTGGSFSRMMRTGVSTFGAPVVSDISNLLPGIASNQSQGFLKLRGTGVTAANDQMLFYYDGTALTSVVREGDLLAPGVNVGTITNARACAGYKAAAVLGLRPSSMVTAASDTALVLDGGIVREGVVSSFGPAYGQFTRIAASHIAPYAIYPCGLVGTGVTAADNLGLEVRLGSTAFAPASFVRKGQLAPYAGGVGTLNAFQSFLGETVNDTGKAAIKAAMALGSGVTAANNEGLWANNGPGGILQLCAQEGDVVTGTARIRLFLQFCFSNEGLLLFTAQLTGPGVNASNDVALFVHTGTALRLLFREGQTAPGSMRAKIGVIQRLDAEITNGVYALLCSLVPETGGAAADSNQMLLVGCAYGTGPLASQRPSPLLVKGQRYERIGADKVSSVSFVSQNADAFGAISCGLPSVVDFQTVFCQVQFSTTDKEMVRVYHRLP